jgi:hypothetical protein
MAKVFLDTNKVLDIGLGRRPEVKDWLDSHRVFISPLSIHILCYAGKIKVPDKRISQFASEYYLVNLTEKVLGKALGGPTPDLEDNIQLHSCADADCDYFLTNDKNILKMKFFGKARISASLVKE